MEQKEKKPEKKKAKKKKGNLLTKILLAVFLLLAVAVGVMGYIAWCDFREVFQDVTVELGTQSLSLKDFMTENAQPKRASFVSDPSTIDLSKVGKTSLTLKHGVKEYQVVLNVQDTTAPAARVEESREVSVGEGIPEAQKLVQEVQDYSAVKIYYAEEPVIPDDYSDSTVTVVLEDEWGNKTEKECTFQYSGWMLERYTLELGTELTADMLMVNPEKDGELLDETELALIGWTVGEHTVTASVGNAQISCTVTVEDTTSPELELQNVRRYPGETAEVSDFVASVSDLSGDPELRMVSEEINFSKQGTYTVVIEAEDASGNVTQEEATLWVSTNMSPPEIKGASGTLSIEKHSDPDLLKGVTAKDDIDKNLEVTVDDSALDVDTAGTYYITYSATDSSGNVGTYKRKVVVEPDEEDTAALVAKTADSLPDDPESIRDYVHDLIAYGSSWGGDDPVWHGLTTNSGNCYVHALTLQALLEYKGYETQLIWVTNESHYWLIIKLDEGWRHIDSTPSAQHEAIGLATDRVRYLNLNGRNWDRSKWPACE